MADPTARRLTEDEHRRVDEAVAQAEMNTSGQIVTVIAPASDDYVDVAIAWAGLAATAALALLALFPQAVLALGDWFGGGSEWNDAPETGAILAAALAVALVAFAAVLLIQQWQPIKFALVPDGIEQRRVRARAVDLFKVSAERRTVGHTGVVIYLSLAEHHAEIIADAAIADKVKPEVWGDAMAAMVAELRQGRIAEGMIAAIGEVGTVLAAHFPRENGRNELPDRLIEL